MADILAAVSERRALQSPRFIVWWRRIGTLLVLRCWRRERSDSFHARQQHLLQALPKWLRQLVRGQSSVIRSCNFPHLCRSVLHRRCCSLYTEPFITLVHFKAFLRNCSDQQPDVESLNVLFGTFPSWETQVKLTSPKNSFTVELLIGFAWTAEQTLYLYFLVLIKLHWELYVFITFLPTP